MVSDLAAASLYCQIVKVHDGYQYMRYVDQSSGLQRFS